MMMPRLWSHYNYLSSHETMCGKKYQMTQLDMKNSYLTSMVYQINWIILESIFKNQCEIRHTHSLIQSNSKFRAFRNAKRIIIRKYKLRKKGTMRCRNSLAQTSLVSILGLWWRKREIVDVYHECALLYFGHNTPTPYS